MTTTTTLPLFTLAQVSEAIESMAKTQLAAANSIAKVIVMAAFAANHGFIDAKTGETKPTAEVANSLFKNLRKGVKKTAIEAVLTECCNLAYISGTWVMYAAAKKVWDVEGIQAVKAAAANWETYKPAVKAEAAVDVVEAFDELVAKLMKLSAKGTLLHAAELVKLQGLLGTMKADALFVD